MTVYETHRMAPASLIHPDLQRGRFLVDKRAFSDPEVFERERKFIFDRCWLYVGHESEITQAGSFITRLVAQYSILFNRDREGKVNAFHNLCTHRGTLLTAEKCGKANVLTCPYHGWTFGADGKLLSQSARYGYDAKFNEDGYYNLRRVPRLEEYRGFWFMNMNPKAIGLEAYLAGSRDWIDMIVDQAPKGLEVTAGEQEFRTGCNWKSISENQIDSYHGMSLHLSYFQYAAQRAKETSEQQSAAYQGSSYALGNGHAGFELGVKTGKPATDWIPAFGEASRPILDANKAAMLEKFGQERGLRMAARTRNMLIFPNTILNDVLSLSVRTSFPESATSTRSNIWNLAHIGEDPAIRKIRMANHLTFVGPGGFAHPDDYEMFDRRAIGDEFSPEFMHDYSKGMKAGEEIDPLNTTGDHADEAQQRAFWTQWDRMLRGVETLEA